MELEQIVKDPALSDARKQQKTMQMRKSEVNFLRFLRTHEKPGNYSTLKIIGKGAFGEVKLVQRKNDGKIYALKSLIKAEMVSSRSNLKRTLKPTGCASVVSRSVLTPF